MIEDELTMRNNAFRINRFILLCVLVMLCFVLRPEVGQAGWIEDTSGGTVLHVSVAELPDPNRIDPVSRANRAAVRAFTEGFAKRFAEKYAVEYKSHPERYGNHDWDHVDVVLEQFTGIRVEGVESDLLAIAGGMAPDVLRLNFRKSDNYIQNGFLYPLDQYLEELTPEEIALRINKKLWPVIRRKGPEGLVHTWAMPYDGALGKVLLYRKDLFDECGLTHPDVQWNWDDMLMAARALTDPEKGTFGIFLRRGKHESWYWLSFLWSAGGDVMVYDEVSDQWSCVFDSYEAALALDFYTKLSAEKWIDGNGRVRRGYSAKDASNPYRLWSSGSIGMMMAYIDERLFADINPEITGVTPVPLGPTGLRGGELNSRMMGLFSDIKEPSIRDAAWEFMRFYDSDAALRIKTRIMVEGGLAQFVNPKYLKRFGFGEMERLTSKELAETFRIAVETGRPEPYGKNSNFAYDLMSLPIQKAEQLALNDQLPADENERLKIMQKLLVDGCARANELMMGALSEKERRTRRYCAAGLLVVMIGFFAWVLHRIASMFVSKEESCAPSLTWRAHLKRFGAAYVLLIPAVATIFVWKYVPLARGAVMAFYDYKLLTKSVFVGLDHFGSILFDSFWWQSLWNAFRYSMLVMVLTFIPPIVLGVVLHEIPRGKLLFRTLFYLPAVITGLVTIVLWKQFYAPTDAGVLNALLLKVPTGIILLAGFIPFGICILFARRLYHYESKMASGFCVIAGLALIWTFSAPFRDALMAKGELSVLFYPLSEPVRWLGNPDTAMFSCVLPMVWAGAGPGCLIYLAALKGIPEEFYEAADLDGSGFIDKVLFIVLPQLKMLLMINFVGVFIGSWYSATGNILVMTGGAANTEVAGLYIWYKAFTFLQFGPATAMAWMLGCMLIGFTVQQLKMLSRVEFKTTT
ncbi:MAG: extracellular solute-binding protein [Spartobacteria bacterium]|nr:extracellular solute-binding protein [Spartobacteria bacterium]